MIDIPSLHRQHEDLLDCAMQVAKHLTIDELVNDSEAARALLERLSNRLSEHLAAEDHDLYEPLLREGDAGEVATARRFQGAVEDLSSVFDDYLRRWPSAESIEARPESYQRETTAILETVGKCMQCEEIDLYRIAERH